MDKISSFVDDRLDDGVFRVDRGIYTQPEIFVAEMERIFGRHACSSSEFRWVNFTDDVGKFRSRRKTFSETVISVPPFYRDLLVLSILNKRFRNTA